MCDGWMCDGWMDGCVMERKGGLKVKTKRIQISNPNLEVLPDFVHQQTHYEFYHIELISSSTLAETHETDSRRAFEMFMRSIQ